VGYSIAGMAINPKRPGGSETRPYGGLTINSEQQIGIRGDSTECEGREKQIAPVVVNRGDLFAGVRPL
jgi:hypothetical protein